MKRKKRKSAKRKRKTAPRRSGAFARCVKAKRADPRVSDAEALCAWIGRRAGRI